MKFTKKMIMVPEAEYVALLNLFSGGDHLKTEKAMTEAKMSRALRNPQLSQLEKGKTYDLLYKKRRQLQKLIDEKPQKILIKSTVLNAQNEPLPTQGVVPAHFLPSQLQKFQEEISEPTNENLDEDDVSEESENLPFTSFREELSEEIEPKKYQTRIKSGIIKPEFYGELKMLVNKQQEKLGITPEGNFYRHLSDTNPIKGSDTKKVLEHIIGLKKAESPGIEFLYRRLLNEPKFQGILEKSGLVKDSRTREKSQLGKGKKYKKYIIAKNKSRLVNKKDLELSGIPNSQKTKGLTRIKFKPKLWVKLRI